MLIPFRFRLPITLINVDGPEQRPVEHEANPNQRKLAPDISVVVQENGIEPRSETKMA